MRLLPLLVCAALLGVTATSVAAARTHAPAGRCDRHASHAIRMKPRVIVYRRAAGLDDFNAPLTDLWACARPDGRSVLVSSVGGADGEYPPNELTADLRVSGDYVAAAYGSGFASQAACGKTLGDSPQCAAAVHWRIIAVDARTRRTTHLAVPGAPKGLAVARSGLLAWIEPGARSSVLEAMRLRPTGAHGLGAHPFAVARGAEISGPLRFVGRTLFYVVAGRPAHATL